MQSSRSSCVFRKAETALAMERMVTVYTVTVA
jgi:hypothetical protein